MIFEEENEIEARVKEIADAVNGANSTVDYLYAIVCTLQQIAMKMGVEEEFFVDLLNISKDNS
jgi:hypothetical protein